MTEPIRTTVRCFRRLEKAEGAPRRAIWIMTRSTGCRGAFYHGDHNWEIVPPGWTVKQLAERARLGPKYRSNVRPPPVEEITPEEVLEELESWPEAREHARRAFERHLVEEAKEEEGGN